MPHMPQIKLRSKWNSRSDHAHDTHGISLTLHFSFSFASHSQFCKRETRSLMLMMYDKIPGFNCVGVQQDYLPVLVRCQLDKWLTQLGRPAAARSCMSGRGVLSGREF